MPKNVRFLDQVSVSAFGSEGGGNAVSASYAETASFAHSATSASYAVTASYAVSASHEIIKEVSSSYADTASFAQSGNGIFSGSFSGSFEGNGSGLTDIPASGITGLNLSQISSGSATASISPDGGFQVNTDTKLSGSVTITGSLEVQSGTARMYFETSASTGSNDGKLLITSISASSNISLNRIDGKNSSLLVGSGGTGFYYDQSGVFGIQPMSNPATATSYPDALAFFIDGNGNVGINTNAPSTRLDINGDIVASNLSGTNTGDQDLSPFVTNSQTSSMTVLSSSFALTSSYVETAQTASYVLNSVSSSFSSFAISASYAVSASHEIIKEVSSSYADTASFAQSGNGLFSGSFSGSFEGDGSNLTGVDPFPFSGSAVITGSLVISGSSKPLEVIGSGSTIFSVQGSLGELFAIDDVLSGSLLTINDSGGDSQFEVFSDGRTLIGGTPRSLYTTATINATLAATSESIYSLSTSSYDGVFFDYTVTSASNARAGNIMSIWNGGNLVYTENTTTDIGSTVGVTFNVEISQSQAQLISLTDTAGWKIKTTIRSI